MSPTEQKPALTQVTPQDAKYKDLHNRNNKIQRSEETLDIQSELVFINGTFRSYHALELAPPLSAFPE